MAKAPDIKLVFYRSGPTEWDEAGRLQGRSDLPLSASGQAGLDDAVAGAIAEIATPPRVVIAAPDEASERIARAIADETGAKLRTVDDLAGLRCGLWEGRLSTELAERSPKAYKQWKQDPASASPPEGEPAIDAQHRVLDALSRALDKVSQGPAVVVLRPTPMGLVRLAIENRPLAELWDAIDETPRLWTVTTPRTALRNHPRPLDASA